MAVAAGVARGAATAGRAAAKAASSAAKAAGRAAKRAAQRTAKRAAQQRKRMAKRKSQSRKRKQAKRKKDVQRKKKQDRKKDERKKRTKEDLEKKKRERQIRDQQRERRRSEQASRRSSKFSSTQKTKQNARLQRDQARKQQFKEKTRNVDKQEKREMRSKFDSKNQERARSRSAKDSSSEKAFKEKENTRKLTQQQKDDIRRNTREQKDTGSMSSKEAGRLKQAGRENARSRLNTSRKKAQGLKDQKRESQRISRDSSRTTRRRRTEEKRRREAEEKDSRENDDGIDYDRYENRDDDDDDDRSYRRDSRGSIIPIPIPVAYRGAPQRAYYDQGSYGRPSAYGYRPNYMRQSEIVYNPSSLEGQRALRERRENDRIYVTDPRTRQEMAVEPPRTLNRYVEEASRDGLFEDEVRSGRVWTDSELREVPQQFAEDDYLEGEDPDLEEIEMRRRLTRQAASERDFADQDPVYRNIVINNETAVSGQHQTELDRRRLLLRGDPDQLSRAQQLSKLRSNWSEERRMTASLPTMSQRVLDSMQKLSPNKRAAAIEKGLRAQGWGREEARRFATMSAIDKNQYNLLRQHLTKMAISGTNQEYNNARDEFNEWLAERQLPTSGIIIQRASKRPNRGLENNFKEGTMRVDVDRLRRSEKTKRVMGRYQSLENRNKEHYDSGWETVREIFSPLGLVFGTTSSVEKSMERIGVLLGDFVQEIHAMYPSEPASLRWLNSGSELYEKPYEVQRRLTVLLRGTSLWYPSAKAKVVQELLRELLITLMIVAVEEQDQSISGGMIERELEQCQKQLSTELSSLCTGWNKTITTKQLLENMHGNTSVFDSLLEESPSEFFNSLLDQAISQFRNSYYFDLSEKRPTSRKGDLLVLSKYFATLGRVVEHCLNKMRVQNGNPVLLDESSGIGSDYSEAARITDPIKKEKREEEEVSATTEESETEAATEDDYYSLGEYGSYEMYENINDYSDETREEIEHNIIDAILVSDLEYLRDSVRTTSYANIVFRHTDYVGHNLLSACISQLNGEFAQYHFTQMEEIHEMMRFLLELGADPNTLSGPPLRNYPSLVRLAQHLEVCLGQDEIHEFFRMMQTLIEYGADPLVRGEKGDSMFYLMERPLTTVPITQYFLGEYGTPLGETIPSYYEIINKEYPFDGIPDGRMKFVKDYFASVHLSGSSTKPARRGKSGSSSIGTSISDEQRKGTWRWTNWGPDQLIGGKSFRNSMIEIARDLAVMTLSIEVAPSRDLTPVRKLKKYDRHNDVLASRKQFVVDKHSTSLMEVPGYARYRRALASMNSSATLNWGGDGEALKRAITYMSGYIDHWLKWRIQGTGRSDVAKMEFELNKCRQYAKEAEDEFLLFAQSAEVEEDEPGANIGPATAWRAFVKEQEKHPMKVNDLEAAELGMSLDARRRGVFTRTVTSLSKIFSGRGIGGAYEDSESFSSLIDEDVSSAATSVGDSARIRYLVGVGDVRRLTEYIYTRSQNAERAPFDPTQALSFLFSEATVDEETYKMLKFLLDYPGVNLKAAARLLAYSLLLSGTVLRENYIWVRFSLYQIIKWRGPNGEKVLPSDVGDSDRLKEIALTLKDEDIPAHKLFVSWLEQNAHPNVMTAIGCLIGENIDEEEKNLQKTLKSDQYLDALLSEYDSYSSEDEDDDEEMTPVEGDTIKEEAEKEQRRLAELRDRQIRMEAKLAAAKRKHERALRRLRKNELRELKKARAEALSTAKSAVQKASSSSSSSSDSSSKESGKRKRTNSVVPTIAEASYQQATVVEGLAREERRNAKRARRKRREEKRKLKAAQKEKKKSRKLTTSTMDGQKGKEETSEDEEDVSEIMSENKLLFQDAIIQALSVEYKSPLSYKNGKYYNKEGQVLSDITMESLHRAAFLTREKKATRQTPFKFYATILDDVEERLLKFSGTKYAEANDDTRYVILSTYNNLIMALDEYGREVEKRLPNAEKQIDSIMERLVSVEKARRPYIVGFLISTPRKLAKYRAQKAALEKQREEAPLNSALRDKTNKKLTYVNEIYENLNASYYFNTKLYQEELNVRKISGKQKASNVYNYDLAATSEDARSFEVIPDDSLSDEGELISIEEITQRSQPVIGVSEQTSEDVFSTEEMDEDEDDEDDEDDDESLSEEEEEMNKFIDYGEEGNPIILDDSEEADSILPSSAAAQSPARTLPQKAKNLQPLARVKQEQEVLTVVSTPSKKVVPTPQTRGISKNAPRRVPLELVGPVSSKSPNAVSDNEFMRKARLARQADEMERLEQEQQKSKSEPELDPHIIMFIRNKEKKESKLKSTPLKSKEPMPETQRKSKKPSTKITRKKKSPVIPPTAAQSLPSTSQLKDLDKELSFGNIFATAAATLREEQNSRSGVPSSSTSDTSFFSKFDI